MVLTVDFFTPIVDDPFDYGRIAAANSLSDVYAMGARPVAALNIAGFPENELPSEVIGDILRGGAATAKEAGIVIVGGHTVTDPEVKYGLSVVGMVHPDEIVQNTGARPGDRIVLTKPLGTGVLGTAVRADDLPAAEYATLVASMTLLNKDASEKMREFGVHAATDITGYGLLGHALEMAKASDVAFDLVAGDVPALPGALDAIGKRYLTRGGKTNQQFVGDAIEWGDSIPEAIRHLLFDAQTSGGLLIALPADRADGFLKALGSRHTAAIVGEVRERVSDKYLRIV